MRSATIQRDTKETRISGSLKIEGRGRYDISTGIRFLDHMLELFSKHGGFDLTLKADGDLDDLIGWEEHRGIVSQRRLRSPFLTRRREDAKKGCVCGLRFPANGCCHQRPGRNPT